MGLSVAVAQEAAGVEERSGVEVLPFVDGGKEPQPARDVDNSPPVVQEIAPAPEMETPAATTESAIEEDPLDAIAAATETGASEPLAKPLLVEQGAITITTGFSTTLDGYVAGPVDSKLAILILPDRWGVNDTVKSWVKRFADKGYRALAIDVFDGRISKKDWLAEEIMYATDPEWVKIDIQAGLDYLKADGRKIVTFGEGFGGWQSFQATVQAPDEVAATIVICNRLEASETQVRALTSPVLAVYAVNDPNTPWQEMEKARVMAKKGFFEYRSYVAPAGFGFMEPAYKKSYDAVATEDAWKEIDGFLAAFVEPMGEQPQADAVN